MTVRPRSVEELRDALRSECAWRVVGSGSKDAFRLAPEGEPGTLDASQITGIVQHDVSDMVVVVKPGTPVAELQAALAEQGQCLPLPSVLEPSAPRLLDGVPGTVGGMCAMNLPHAFCAQYGGPREWVLGLTVALADGRIAKSGSKVVKNVAGFDVHKLMIGARGTLGVVVEAILRTFPIQAIRPGQWRIGPARADGPVCVHRTLRSDFAQAAEGAGDRLIATDPASSTIWVAATPSEIVRFPNDWVFATSRSSDACEVDDPAHRRLMLRAKQLYDPCGKLNPGEFGFL